MSTIKLIVIDIGGTLIDDYDNISFENIKILKKVKQRGVKIALATARMLSSTKYISNAIGCDYGIYGNGSNIIDLSNNNILYLDKLSHENLAKLIKFGKKERVYIQLNQVFQEVSEQKKYFTLKHIILNKKYSENLQSNVEIVSSLEEYIKHTDNIVKLIFASNNNLDYIKKEIELNFTNTYITEYNTNLNEAVIKKTINYIEIGVKNTNKAFGIKKLADILGLAQEEILVIGDGNNDIEMFETFKNSGCLKNGPYVQKKLPIMCLKKQIIRVD